MMWTKLEVYNYDEYLGSIYSDATTRKGLIEDINIKFGSNWTKYNIGN